MRRIVRDSFSGLTLFSVSAVLAFAVVAGNARPAAPAQPAALEAPAAEAQGVYDWPQFQGDVKRTGRNTYALTGPFTKRWTRNLGVPLAHRVQPVVANGYVVVGDSAGMVYGLNESNGNLAWSYQTGGAITFSAAIDMTSNRVFVPSQDGYLYALNLTNGALVWQVKPGRKPLGGSPLLYNNRLYVGGKDGYFYALNLGDGSAAWTFDTAAAGWRAPILSAAAISPAKGRVYFAAENVRAYALDLNTGALAWSYQMYGESVADSWPVVSEYHDVVMFRTKSVYSFHSSLGLDDADLFCPGDQDTACGSCANWNPDNYNAPNNNVTNGSAQWDEQHGATNSIDWILNTYPQRRTFFALDLDDGAHRPAPILWTGGGGRAGIPPVVNDSTGDIYVFARTKYSRRDTTYFCRKWVDLVRLTFSSGQGTFNFLSCPSGTHCPDSWGFHFIGDESTIISMSGNTILGTGWYHTGSVRVNDGAYYDISGSTGYPEGTNGNGDDHSAPAAVANGHVFVKQRGVVSSSGPMTAIVMYAGAGSANAAGEPRSGSPLASEAGAGAP